MILVAVYIPPVLTPTASCDIIHSALDCLQIQHLTAFLTAKNRAVRAGNRDQNRRATDRENKDNDRRKLGRRPQQISMRVVSSGMKTVTGFRPSNSRGDEGDELNLFCNRFNTAIIAHPLT